MRKEEMRVIARNKKANHEYFILETYEAGIVLYGTEIKSIRNTKVSIQDAYCEIKNQEMFIISEGVMFFRHRWSRRERHM